MSNTIIPITPTHSANNNLQKMSAYKTNNINNQLPPPYKPLEEIITVRELLRRLADGKVVLETKVKI